MHRMVSRTARISLSLLLPVAAQLAHSTVARAQSTSVPSDRVGYVGLIHTPVGLFTPLITTAGRSAESGWALAARYARLPDSRQNNPTEAHAGTAEVSVVDKGTVSFTVGRYRGECPDPECSWKVVLGAGVSRALASVNVLTLRAEGNVGWSEQEFSTTYLTGHLALPVAASFEVLPELRLIPYIAPGYGVIRARVTSTPAGNHTGSRFTVGAGVGLAMTDLLVIHFGALRIPISDGSTAAGVAFTLLR
jgi:hypothetical protein